MLITKAFILIMALSVVSAQQHYNLRSHYNWDEYIQICSSALADLVKAICPSSYNEDYRPKLRIQRSAGRGGISRDCCERQCTPRYILYNYCQYSERINTNNDLVIWTTEKPATPVTPIPTGPTTTQTRYCYQQNFQGTIVLWECEKGDIAYAPKDPKENMPIVI